MRSRRSALHGLIRVVASVAMWTVPASATAQSTPTPRAPGPEPAVPALEFGDRANNLRVEFIAQLRAEYGDADLSAPGGDTTGVEFRRVRPRLRGSFLDGRLRMFLQMNTSVGSFELLDLFLDVIADAQVQLRVGQRKIPLTRWRINSFAQLPFTDWAPTVTWLGPERLLGVALHNGTERPPEWEYELGVYTGVNARRVHGTGIALAQGEPVPGYSEIGSRATPPDVHPELVVRGAWNQPGIDAADQVDYRRGPLRASLGWGAAWDLRPDRTQDFSLRIVPEALLKLEGFSLLIQGFFGFRDGAQSGIVTPAMVSALSELSYRFEAAPLHVGLRWSGTFIDPTFSAESRARADQRIAAATPEDRAALTRQYRDAGAILADYETTVCLTWQIFGSSLSAQLEGSWLRQERTGGARDGARGRLQLLLQL